MIAIVLNSNSSRFLTWFGNNNYSFNLHCEGSRCICFEITRAIVEKHWLNRSFARRWSDSYTKFLRQWHTTKHQLLDRRLGFGNLWWIGSNSLVVENRIQMGFEWNRILILNSKSLNEVSILIESQITICKASVDFTLWIYVSKYKYEPMRMSENFRTNLFGQRTNIRYKRLLKWCRRFKCEKQFRLLLNFSQMFIV